MDMHAEKPRLAVRQIEGRHAAEGMLVRSLIWSTPTVCNLVRSGLVVLVFEAGSDCYRSWAGIELPHQA